MKSVAKTLAESRSILWGILAAVNPELSRCSTSTYIILRMLSVIEQLQISKTVTSKSGVTFQKLFTVIKYITNTVSQAPLIRPPKTVEQ